MVTVVACALLLWANFSGSRNTLLSPQVLAADDAGKLRWYRGNIHTHSMWSDGDDYPEMIAAWYVDHGYNFLALSDHNVLATIERWIDVQKSKGGQVAYDKLKARFPADWVEERTVEDKLQVRLKKFTELESRFNVPGKFLMVQGEEVTDKFKNLPVHMNATNVRDLIPPLGGESVYNVIQNNTDALLAQRERTRQPMMIHLNHPNFGYGVTAEDMVRVRGEKFFEVYNGHPGVNNKGDATHASVERIWDIILTKRLAELDLPLMYGLATDDSHAYHKIPSRASEPGRGWIMVLADDLNPTSLLAAMEEGRFYASSGVFLKRVVTTPKSIEIAVEPQDDVQYTIEFIGTKKGYNPDSKPVFDKDGKELPVTRTYSDDIGTVLKRVEGTQAVYEFAGDEIYVRPRVTSTKQHPNPSQLGEFERAWAQPTLGPAVMEKSNRSEQ